MKIVLDTDICLQLICEKPKKLIDKINSYKYGDIAISMVTLHELLYGAYKSKVPVKNREAVKKFVLSLKALPFEQNAADTAGRIRAYLERTGSSIGALDAQIAATAMAHDLTLVTNNLDEFKTIPNIKVESWT